MAQRRQGHLSHPKPRGGPGDCGKEWLEKADGSILSLSGNDSCQVKINDLFVMETPGGGAFGKK